MTDAFAIWPSAGNLIFLSPTSPSANGSDTNSYFPALFHGKTICVSAFGELERKQYTKVIVGPLAEDGFCLYKGCKNQVRIQTKTTVWTETTCGPQGPRYFTLWFLPKHNPYPHPTPRPRPEAECYCHVRNRSVDVSIHGDLFTVWCKTQEYFSWGIHHYTEIIDDTSTGNKGLCLLQKYCTEKERGSESKDEDSSWNSTLNLPP